MITTIIVAKSLGAEVYGQFGIIQSTIGVMAIIGGLGLGLSGTRYMAELRDDDKTRGGNIWALFNVLSFISGGVMTLLVAMNSSWISEALLKAPELSPALSLSSLLLIIGAYSSVQTGMLSGFEDFRSIARVAAVQGVSTLLLSVPGVLLFDLVGAIGAIVFGQFIGLLLTIRALREVSTKWRVRASYRGAVSEVRVLWLTAFPLMLSGVMVAPVMWGANYSLIVYSDKGYYELGLFVAANNWRVMLVTLSTVLGGVLTPILANSLRKGELGLEELNMLLGWFSVTLIAIPLMVVPDFVVMLYGGDYNNQQFKDALSLMLLSACVIAYKSGVARKLIVNNRMWFSLASNFLWSLIFVALLYVFRGLGAYGVSLAFAISHGLNFILVMPFYISMGVAPRELMFSSEIIIIWALVLAALLVALLNLGVVDKVFILVVCYVYIIRYVLKQKNMLKLLGA